MTTQKQARQACKALGFTFRRTDYGEYRIAPINASEDSAYYTDDIDDAIATAWCEANRVTCPPLSAMVH